MVFFLLLPCWAYSIAVGRQFLRLFLLWTPIFYSKSVKLRTNNSSRGRGRGSSNGSLVVAGVYGQQQPSSFLPSLLPCTNCGATFYVEKNDVKSENAIEEENGKKILEGFFFTVNKNCSSFQQIGWQFYNEMNCLFIYSIYILNYLCQIFIYIGFLDFV